MGPRPLANNTQVKICWRGSKKSFFCLREFLVFFQMLSMWMCICAHLASSLPVRPASRLQSGNPERSWTQGPYGTVESILPGSCPTSVLLVRGLQCSSYCSNHLLLTTKNLLIDVVGKQLVSREGCMGLFSAIFIDFIICLVWALISFIGCGPNKPCRLSWVKVWFKCDPCVWKCLV